MIVVPDWAVGGAVLIFAASLAQIVVVKLRASLRIPPPPRPDSDELRQALDAVQNRLGEIEERLDFAERLLATQRDANRLEPPK